MTCQYQPRRQAHLLPSKLLVVGSMAVPETGVLNVAMKYVLSIWLTDLSHVKASVVCSCVGGAAGMGRQGGYSCQAGVQQGSSCLGHNVLLTQACQHVCTSRRTSLCPTLCLPVYMTGWNASRQAAMSRQCCVHWMWFQPDVLHQLLSRKAVLA